MIRTVDRKTLAAHIGYWDPDAAALLPKQPRFGLEEVLRLPASSRDAMWVVTRHRLAPPELARASAIDACSAALNYASLMACAGTMNAILLASRLAAALFREGVVGDADGTVRLRRDAMLAGYRAATQTEAQKRGLLVCCTYVPGWRALSHTRACFTFGAEGSAGYEAEAMRQRASLLRTLAETRGAESDL